ncbi:hypothetical protein CYMTET_26424 [Cymbomonas tetramitiformis]|uniref:TLC domain-containing protein n=1 Tax=Cymbomonas tetramitiformis TaxID=36881 RepID=A0AAE0FTB5_9CHLO|nr:hypothetical protein CYMTET_26424 [Cymbomonas tetramitiformis]|eukprot:gene24096-29240_t
MEIEDLIRFGVLYFIGATLVTAALAKVFVGMGFKENTKAGSAESIVIAYNLVVLMTNIYMAIEGVNGWWFSPVPADKLFGEFQPGPFLKTLQVVYQFWNCFACLAMTQYRTWDAILHHTLTGTLSYFFLVTNHVDYFCVFFGGLVEISNLPLCIVDICKNSPTFRQYFPTLNQICRYLFAVAFILIRNICWPIVCYEYWVLSIEYLTSKVTDDFMFSVSLFGLTVNVALTGLQFFWGYKIASMIKKVLVGGGKAKNKSA